MYCKFPFLVSNRLVDDFAFTVFQSQQGYVDAGQALHNKDELAKTLSQHDELEQDVNRLRLSVSAMNSFRQHKSIKITRMEGLVRFEESLDKIHSIDLSTQSALVKEYASAIPCQLVEFKGQRLPKPLYKDCDHKDLYICVYYSEPDNSNIDVYSLLKRLLIKVT